MLVLEQALVAHLETVGEHRRRKTLAPGFGFHQGCRVQVHQRRFQCAVGFYRTGERRRFDHVGHRLFKRFAKARQIVLAQRQAGGHRVAAEADDEAGLALGHEVERVAQVQAGDGAAGALEFPFVAAREGNGRAVRALLDARGHDADDALVPVRVEQRQRRRFTDVDAGQLRLGFLLHALFDVAPFSVHRVELFGQRQRACEVVGDQAFDADGHVREAPGGIEARPDREAEVEGVCA